MNHVSDLLAKLRQHSFGQGRHETVPLTRREALLLLDHIMELTVKASTQPSGPQRNPLDKHQGEP